MEMKLSERYAVGEILVAGATAAATPAASTRKAARRLGRSAVAGAIRSGENGKLDGGFLAGTLRAGDFLLLIDHDLFKAGFAFVADVFVNGHLCLLSVFLTSL